MQHRPTLRIMTLNLAHGRGLAQTQLWLPPEVALGNLDAASDVLSREAPDVVALQEADGPSSWSGGFDHVRYVARKSGHRHAFRGSHSGSTGRRLGLDYGTALLARTPLSHTRSRAFGHNWRDTKGYVSATVHLDGAGEVDVVSVHLDFLRNGVRRQQVAELVNDFSTRRRPVVILGDLNCTGTRRSSAVTLLARQLDLKAWRFNGHAPTFPAPAPRNRIDWILASRELDFVSHTTLRDQVSDHLGVVAELAPAA